MVVWVLAGLLVGFGTKLANGCTSGHGVCGLPRLSKRSMTAVFTFVGAGIAMATLRYNYPFLKGGVYFGEEVDGYLNLVGGLLLGFWLLTVLIIIAS